MNQESKILILGASGMLGTDLMQVFSHCSPVGWDIDDIDITDAKQVRKKITDLNPAVVINAAAFTDVDGCESAREECLKINGEAVGILAKTCRKINAVLVHISTDYIFNGDNDRGYREDAIPDPINIYGTSKLLGEKRLIENTDKYFLIRTSWLFGQNGKNFVSTILDLAHERKQIDVVDDQTGSPTYTLDLASQIKQLVASGTREYGVYHVTNRGTCTWCGLAREIVRLSHSRCVVNPVTSDSFPRPARRPRYSVLINSRFTSTIRHWKDAVAAYFEQLKEGQRE